jgi:adenylate cyclase
MSRFNSKTHNLLSRNNNLSQATVTFASTVVLTSLVVTGLTVGLRQFGKLEGLELGAFDQLMRLRPDEGQDNRILVVGINDTDIQTRQEYPIEDGTLATAFTKLEQHKPRVIGLDIARDVKQGSASGREALVKQLSTNENIVAACKLSDAESPGIAAAPGVSEERVGVADLSLDPGGTLRRTILLSIPKASRLPIATKHICNHVDPENQLPSLSLQMVVRYLEPQGITPELTKSGDFQFGSTVFKRLTPNSGGYYNADTADYQILLNYRSARNSVKQVSLIDVLNDKVDPALIKDRIVMIGYTAPIVKDDFYTPYSGGARDSQKMPGVVVHAQSVSQMLSAILNKRPLFWYWNQEQEAFWILGWSLLAGTLAWRIRKPWLLVVAFGVTIAVLFGSTYIIFLQAGWIPLVPPLMGILTTALSVVLIDRYAATIVKTVKGFLKINIDIDEQKKEEEVAAIIESDYFAELQQKAKGLRASDSSENSENAEKRENSDNSQTEENFSPPEISYTPPTQEQLDPVQLIQSTIQSTEDVDYLQQVRDRRKQRQVAENIAESNTDTTTDTNTNIDIPATEGAEEQQEETEYWKQLKARSQKEKQKKNEQ